MENLILVVEVNVLVIKPIKEITIDFTIVNDNDET